MLMFFIDFSAFHPELSGKQLLNTPRPPPAAVAQPPPQILPPTSSHNGLRNFYEQNMMQLNLLRATNPALAAHFPALGLPGLQSGLQSRPQLPQLRPPFSLPQLRTPMHNHLNVC